MKKRKRNPYQLTDEEKLAVVDLYARFQITPQVVTRTKLSPAGEVNLPNSVQHQRTKW